MVIGCVEGHYKHLFSREGNTQKIYAPSKVQGTISQWNRCLKCLKSWLSDNRMRLWSDSKKLGRSVMETIIFGWWWRCHQAVTQRFWYTLCYALERWTRTEHQILSGKTSWRGWRVHHKQNFGYNWWWANGIGVEYFPRIHHIAALQQSPRVLDTNER